MTATHIPLLLVDDEEGIRIVLSALLQDMGYEVSTASDGREALAAFRKKPFSLVLTDIKMPGMDGIALLQELKNLEPRIEVIMLTGHGDMELAVSSLRLGAGDFLNKPVSDNALEVALNRAKERMNIREALRKHTEELEKLVEERTRALVDSERFAAVGEAAAGLAHAIKNIAGALEGTMYVLEKAIAVNNRDHLEEGWNMVRSEISRLHGLAVGLLELGRPLAPVYSLVPPGRPAADVLELVAARASEGGVQLEMKNEAGATPVHMAEALVHQCLLNLVLNALEAFTPADAFGFCGPALAGASSEAGPAPQVRVSVRWGKDGAGEARLLYLVSDNGPGLPKERGSNFSDTVFHSGKEGGSGIGLFATRRMAHAMGAELYFANNEGGGTEVRLALPVGGTRN